MKRVDQILNNTRGNVMILVLIIAGVMGVTLSTLTVYSVNQANYLNRVREAYSMMTITEAIAKSASQARNLARQKLLQLGISPDQDAATVTAQYAAHADVNKADCDGGNGASMQQVNGLYYCLQGVAPYQVCVERPDSTNPLDPELVCSNMEFTENKIKINIDTDDLLPEPTAFSEAGELMASFFPKLEIPSRSLSKELIQNNNSGIKMIAKALWENRPGVKAEYNMAYAGGINSSGNFVSIDAASRPPDISHDTVVDPVKVKQIEDYLAAVSTHMENIKSHNDSSVATGLVIQLMDPTSMQRVSNYLRSIDSGPYRSKFTYGGGVSENKIESLADDLQGFLDNKYDLNSDGVYDETSAELLTANGASFWMAQTGSVIGGSSSGARKWLNKFVDSASNWRNDNGFGGIDAPVPVILNADSNHDEAINPVFALELLPCDALDRCVQVQAESKRALEASGSFFLQNVFVE